MGCPFWYMCKMSDNHCDDYNCGYFSIFKEWLDDYIKKRLEEIL